MAAEYNLDKCELYFIFSPQAEYVKGEICR